MDNPTRLSGYSTIDAMGREGVEERRLTLLARAAELMEGFATL